MIKIQTDNPTETKLLQTAQVLFWKHGIKRVSVEEICEKAEVSKMTFYRYYKNKIEIAKDVMNRVVAYSKAKYRSIMDEDTEFKFKVMKLVQIKEEDSAGISKELVLDIHTNQLKELSELLTEHQQTMMTDIMQDFGESSKNGEIRKDLRLEFVLYQLNDMRTKMQDPNLNALYETEQDLIMEMTRFFFYGIMP